MGFHGTIEKPTLDAFTPLTDGGALLGVGGTSDFIGGLSTYSELVLVVGAAIAPPPIGVIEVAFYPSDDPVAAQAEVSWGQIFTVDLTQGSATWRIPLSAGTVQILNQSVGGSGTIRYALYATQAQHAQVIQEGQNVTPRHFTYTGALPGSGFTHVPASDGLTNIMTGNGLASVSVEPSVAVNCSLRWELYDDSGALIRPLIGPDFTVTTVFNQVALPGVPARLVLGSNSAISSVTVDIIVTPANSA